MKRDLKNIKNLSNWIIKVIESSVTIDQLKTSKRLIDNFRNYLKNDKNYKNNCEIILVPILYKLEEKIKEHYG